MSERRQSGLSDFDAIDPDSLFDDFRDYIGGIVGSVRSRIRETGIDTQWWGKSPFEVEPEGDVWVYQRVVAYSKGAMSGQYDFNQPDNAREGSPSPELQFKTGVFVVGEPTDRLEQRIDAVDNPRTRTLFNTGPYQSYLDGFHFEERAEYRQRERVSAREVDAKGYGLGVPWWEVEAYDDDGTLTGSASGYFDPFTTETRTEFWERGEDPPQREVWKVGSRQKHESGDRYQIAPEGRDSSGRTTGAKQRAKEAAGKTAIINGHAVGSILTEGRIRLKVAYKNPNRATYSSRRDILEGTGTPYQALSQGANIYKVQETDDRVVFSTTKPQNFEAPDPDDISPDAVGVERGSEEVTEILLDDDEPTTFVVEEDERVGRMLGLYDPPVTRSIAEGWNAGRIA